MKTYDYIIIGAGASGLMLADALCKDPFFKEKRILLLDRDLKRINDRTWCFWEEGKGHFDPILHKSWDKVHIGTGKEQLHWGIAPYSYKMVTGLAFYEDYLERLLQNPQIHFLQDTVTEMEDKGKEVVVSTQNNTFTGRKVFNSIFNYNKLLGQTKYPVLQQHFIGWTVVTENPVFDPSTVTFMDFSVPQQGNTRFMYVLPFSENRALVEYTLFSERLLPDLEYGSAIATYLEDHLQSGPYIVLEKERGSIPMTCYNFNAHNSKNLLHIGLAGGWAKPSSGYTFRYSYEKTKLLLTYLKKDLPLQQFFKKDRFWYYDLLLLDILSADNAKGQLIFGQLFRKRGPHQIFKFLDGETNIWEDLNIIAACPKIEFTKALFKRLFLK